MEKTLRPCPFCGAEAEIVRNGSGSYFVRCTNKQCATKTRLYHENENGARLAWNRRAERTARVVEENPGDWECDACGGGIYWDSSERPNVKYCPNCGARVVIE